MFLTWLCCSFMVDLFRKEAPKGCEKAKHTSGHGISGLHKILEHDTTDNYKSNAGRFNSEVFVNRVQDKGER